MDTGINRQRLIEEFDSLRKRLVEVEGQVQERLGGAADEALRRMRKIVGREPVDGSEREALIRALAELKAHNRGDNQAVTHWLEAEEEVDLMLDRLGLSPTQEPHA
jgi:predicted metal-dependent phosphoesterase TrpH